MWMLLIGAFLGVLLTVAIVVLWALVQESKMGEDE